jgi:hypothetical protein
MDFIVDLVSSSSLDRAVGVKRTTKITTKSTKHTKSTKERKEMLRYRGTKNQAEEADSSV